MIDPTTKTRFGLTAQKRFRLDLGRARLWLFAAICFSLPMRVSFVYIFSALLLLVTIAEGGFGEKIRGVLRSRLCMAFVAYYLVFLLALLWTDDMEAGLQMVDRQTPFLLFLLFWTCADPGQRERNLSAFVAGAALCALLAHYNFLQLHYFPGWPDGVRVSKSALDTAPFVDWIMYAPMLALAGYFSLQRVFRVSGLRARAVAVAVSCLLLSNLAFSNGRAGMAMFVALMLAFVMERARARLRALLISGLVLPLALVGMYHLVDGFATRVDEAVADIRGFEQNQNTSVGQRLVYWTTSFALIAEHPVFGVGSGDFQAEYAKIKPAEWAETPDSFNPHNQFLMTGATTGLLGLAALFGIFFRAVRSRSDARMCSVLFGFAVVCLFESYLWRSNTALAFSILVAVLAAKGSESRRA